MTSTTISHAFSSLSDPRMERAKRHPLVNILTISICAIIAGCNDFQSISEYGKSKKVWFAQFLDLEQGIPSRDTFNDVLNRLNPQEFAQAFTQWVCSLGDLQDDKGNQGEFYDDIQLFMDEQVDQKFLKYSHDVFTDIHGDHGRIETRRVWLTHEVDWLIHRHPRWTSLKGIVVVESTREIGDKTTYERRDYITSHQDKKAQFIAHAIRSHWHVENKLHWQLDVSFDEDKNRLRSGSAAENISLMNKIALN